MPHVSLMMQLYCKRPSGTLVRALHWRAIDHPEVAARRCHSPNKKQQMCYIWPMNSKQLKKWLEQQGATFQPGKGSHLKVFLNGKQSTLPIHGTAELGKGLEAAIKRQLGLK